MLLGGPEFMMMGPLVYVQFAAKSNWPFGAAVSFILMTATLLLTAGANLATQGGDPSWGVTLGYRAAF